MAARAGRIVAVLLHPFAHGERLLAVGVVREWRHVRRRRGRRRADQVFEDPLATHDRRRAVGVRSHHENTAFSEKPLSSIVGERHPPELTAVHIRDAVVSGQTLVDERVVGGQQIDHVTVFAHDAVEEQLGLAQERLSQVVVEVGKRLGVRDNAPKIAELQPLAGEVGDQRFRLGIRQHPTYLPLEHRRGVQPALRCDGEQFVVRDAAPQEERQLRRKLEVADAIHRPRRQIGGLAFEPKHEHRTRKQASECGLNAGLERPFAAASLVEVNQRLQVELGDRPAKRATRKRRDDLSCTCELRRRARRPERACQALWGLAEARRRWPDSARHAPSRRAEVRRRRPTREDPAATGRVARTLAVERADDRECVDVGPTREVVRIDRAA